MTLRARDHIDDLRHYARMRDGGTVTLDAATLLDLIQDTEHFAAGYLSAMLIHRGGLPDDWPDEALVNAYLGKKT